MHHAFADYCLTNKTTTNLSEEELLLSPTGDEFGLPSMQRPAQSYPQYIANLNQLNGVAANANRFRANSLKELNGFPALNQQQQTGTVQKSTECIMHPNLFAAAAAAAQHSNVPSVPNQQLQPSIICTSADQQTATIIQQPLQLLIDDQSDLNTTDINMDSSPCSESASELNLKQFNRSHKDGKCVRLDFLVI